METVEVLFLRAFEALKLLCALVVTFTWGTRRSLLCLEEVIKGALVATLDSCLIEVFAWCSVQALEILLLCACKAFLFLRHLVAAFSWITLVTRIPLGAFHSLSDICSDDVGLGAVSSLGAGDDFGEGLTHSVLAVSAALGS